MVLLAHPSGGTGIHFKPMLLERRNKRKGFKSRMIQTVKELDTSLCSNHWENPSSVPWKAVFRYMKDCPVEEKLDSVHLMERLWTLCLNLSHQAERIQRGASWSVFKDKFTTEQRRHIGLAMKHHDSVVLQRRKGGGRFQLGLERPFLTKHSPNGMGCPKNLPPVIVQRLKMSYRSLEMRVGVDVFSTSVSVLSPNHWPAFLYLSRESCHHSKHLWVILSVLGRSHWEELCRVSTVRNCIDVFVFRRHQSQ